MDRLVSIPERVCVGLTECKQLTPLSPDVFVSIPERDSALTSNRSKSPPALLIVPVSPKLRHI
jgi:hypothetical protein